MVKKRVSILLMALLLLGTVACGKNEELTEELTKELTEVATTEVTEEMLTTEEVSTTELATEVTTEECTAETTEEEVGTQETATEETADASQISGSLTPQEAQALIEKTIGTADEETGNTFSFMHVNTMEVNGVEYHVFVWNWYVDGHSSHLTDLFVATDGSGIYEGLFVGDGATVYTETNYLEQ